MRILALDTSTDACSIAYLNDVELKARHEIIPKQHARCILRYIEELAGTELASLDALAWGCGPGSFTGLRIAASVIQALAYAYQLPVINISSLAALAQTAYTEYGWQQMLVAVDARMGEVYWGVYCVNEQGVVELVGEEGVGVAASINLPWLSLFKGGGYFGVGDGWGVYHAQLSAQFSSPPALTDPNCMPRASSVVQLARLKYQKGELSQPFDALPVYLRDNIYKNSPP